MIEDLEDTCELCVLVVMVTDEGKEEVGGSRHWTKKRLQQQIVISMQQSEAGGHSIMLRYG